MRKLRIPPLYAKNVENRGFCHTGNISVHEWHHTKSKFLWSLEYNQKKIKWQ